MQLPVTYVWTHDSIGLGEDGPTHQPIEHLAALRAIPGLDVVRPADANETAVAWRTILEHTDRPAGLVLTRQNLPVFDREVFSSAEGVARGGYVLAEASSGTPEVILMGTGSEVQIAVAAREALEADGIPTRVVSMPCVEWFAEQDRGVPRAGAAADGARPGERRGGRADGLAGVRRRRRPDRRHQPLRRQRRLHRALRAVRPHRTRPSWRPRRESIAGCLVRADRTDRTRRLRRRARAPHRRPLRTRCHHRTLATGPSDRLQPEKGT